MNLKDLIVEVPDFPEPGVLFRDITPILKNNSALDEVAQAFSKIIDRPEVELIAGIEARGFILGMLLASYFKKGFLPFRKAGKLPPPTVSTSYALEYAKASIEVKSGSEKIVIVDDVLATGGTLQAAIDLAKLGGYEVIDVGVMINLTYLNQMTFRDKEIFSVLQY